jgi:hypothetical protein
MEEEITRNPKKKDKMQQDFSGKVAEVIPVQKELAKVIRIIVPLVIFYF